MEKFKATTPFKKYSRNIYLHSKTLIPLSVKQKIDEDDNFIFYDNYNYNNITCNVHKGLSLGMEEKIIENRAKLRVI